MLQSWWQGAEIYFKINGEMKETIPRAFRVFQYCVSPDQVDVENDKFTLQSSGRDGVCITSIVANETQIFVGKKDKKLNFWIDGNQNQCTEDFMSTAQLTVKNGKVVSSRCKGYSEIFVFC